MDVAALSTIMSKIQVKQQAGIQLASKAMDISKQNGSNLIKMMEVNNTLERTVNPSVGSKVDIRL